MRKYYYIILLILFFSLPTVNAKVSALSIDPEGKHFLQRSFGDTFNCGPLTALIARQYADKEFDVRIPRNEIFKARGLVNSFNKKPLDADHTKWWKLRDIQVYLKFMGIGTEKHKITQGENTTTQIQNLIEEKNLVIVNINMNDISYGRETGKPYRTFYFPGGWGHYLAIIGYEKRNNETYFEVHDTFSFRGRNRLLSAKQIVRAMKRYHTTYLKVKQGV